MSKWIAFGVEDFLEALVEYINEYFEEGKPTEIVDDSLIVGILGE